MAKSRYPMSLIGLKAIIHFKPGLVNGSAGVSGRIVGIEPWFDETAIILDTRSGEQPLMWTPISHVSRLFVERELEEEPEEEEPTEPITEEGE